MGATAMPMLTTLGCIRTWTPRAPASCKPSTPASSAHAELWAGGIQWAAAGQAETSSARPATATAVTRTDLRRHAATIACRRGREGRDCSEGLAGRDCSEGGDGCGGREGRDCSRGGDGCAGPEGQDCSEGGDGWDCCGGGEGWDCSGGRDCRAAAPRRVGELGGLRCRAVVLDRIEPPVGRGERAGTPHAGCG